LTKTLKVGAVTAGGAIVGTLGTALFKGFNRLKGIEQATAKLKGLGHSGATVQKIMDNALASVQGTAFGLDEAATVAATTVAAGVKPGKELEKTLKLVGDAATIAGVDLTSMSSIFGKVAASNKIQGDVIAQLNDAGIPIVQLLGKELGTTAEETLKLASEGKVNFATFQKAMQKGLGGAALESGKTVSGAFANMQAALGRLGAKLLGPAFASLPAFLSGLTERLDSLGPVAEKVGKVVGAAFSKIAPVVMRLRDGVGDLVAAFARSDLAASLGKSLAGAGAALGKFMTRLGRVDWAGFSREIATKALPVFQAMSAFITDRVLPAIKSLGEYLGTNLAPIISQAFGIFRTEVVPILSALYTWLYAKVAPAVADLAAKVGKNLKPVFDSLFEVIRTSILPAIQQMLAKLREWGPTIGKVVGFVGTLVGKWIEFYTTIAGKVLPVVIRFIGYVIRTMGPAISGIASNIATGIRGLVSFGTAVWNAGKAVVDFAKKVGNKIGQVVTWFTNLPGRITTALGDLGTYLLESGRTLIQGFIDGIKSKAEDLANAAKGVFSVLDPLVPWSPVKKGPLRKWNGGKPGKNLMAMFATGISKGGDQVVKALKKVFDRINAAAKKGSLTKGMAAQIAAIQKAVTSANKLRNLISARDDLWDSLTSGLRGEWNLSEMAGLNEFGLSQGPGALVNAAAAIASRMKAFAGKLAALVKKGLPGALINEIAGYGSQEGGRIADLFLQMTKPQLASLKNSYASFNADASTAGLVAANSIYGSKIDRADADLQKSIKAIGRDVRKAFQESPMYLKVGNEGAIRIYTIGKRQSEKRH